MSLLASDEWADWDAAEHDAVSRQVEDEYAEDEAAEAAAARAAVEAGALCPDCENWKAPGERCVYCAPEPW